MNKVELNDLIRAILERGNPRYTTQSGAFLEFLRKLAKNRKIDEISEACLVFCEVYPETKAFITARIPGILVNHYFTIRDDLDFNKFIKFSVKTKNWADKIRKTIHAPNHFRNEVEVVIEKANKLDE